jgi:hypothetical protein
MRRYGQREFVAREQNAAALLVAEIDVLFQLSKGSDSILELPFPIVPEFRVPAVPGPITWRV